MNNNLKTILSDFIESSELVRKIDAAEYGYSNYGSCWSAIDYAVARENLPIRVCSVNKVVYLVRKDDKEAYALIGKMREENPRHRFRGINRNLAGGRILADFVEGNERICAVDWCAEGYVNPKSCYTTLHAAAKRHHLPVRVSMSDHDIYLIRVGERKTS